MSASWSFGRLAHLQQLQVSNLTTGTQHKSQELAVSGPPPQTVQHPQGAIVEPAQQLYHGRHLLAVPIEIRQIVWAYLAASISDERRPLPCKPKSQILGLLLACRQTYHEVHKYWRRFDVPWNRLRKFLSDPPNRVNITQFRSLTIEIRLDAHAGYIAGLTRFVHCAVSKLRELRLHFVGPDLYGTQSYIHGCGNIDREGQETKLPIDGQQFSKLFILWDRIIMLRNLEILVITNANLQCYQAMFLSNKPFLRYLHLSADPRSTPHCHPSVKILGRLLQVPEKDAYPPIKVLQIAANATVCSIQIATKVMETLEHLTWTVPDPSLSSGMIIPGYEHTAILISTLRLRGPGLNTLRICLGGAGLYEHSTGYDDMIGSIRMNLPFLRNLRHLEIHMKNKSPYFGRELLQSLPSGLEHLYVSDYFVHPYDLLEWVWTDILTGIISGKQPGISFIPSYRSTECLHGEESRKEESLQPYLPCNPEPWLIRLDSFSYHYSDYDDEVYENKSLNDRLIRRRTDRERDLYLDGLTGSDMTRNDYVPFHTGNLRFVHFEFDHSTTTLHKPNDITPLQTLLYVNGRLLDRSRNRHLQSLRPGSFIPPKKLELNTAARGSTVREEIATDSSCLQYSVMLYNVYIVETTHPRDVMGALAELEESELVDDEHYFGQEAEAKKIFDSESVAKIDELPELRYPVEREVHVNGMCHWSSPDAVPPSVDERDRNW